MSFIERIIKPFAPHLCIVCGDTGNVLCNPCRLSSLLAQPSVCFMCNSITQNFRVCKKCIHKTKLRSVWSVATYDGVVKNVVHAYKFTPARSASTVLATCIVDTLPLVQYDIITHIPTATHRYRQRGFDHAELLSREVAKRLNLPHRRVLARVTQSRQVGSTRKERIEQAERAFRLCVQTDAIQKKRILIIDDVMSTGATLMGAAKLLKEHGALEVSAAVVAHNKQH